VVYVKYVININKIKVLLYIIIIVDIKYIHHVDKMLKYVIYVHVEYKK
jgi:hypothetical protein